LFLQQLELISHSPLLFFCMFSYFTDEFSLDDGVQAPIVAIMNSGKEEVKKTIGGLFDGKCEEADKATTKELWRYLVLDVYPKAFPNYKALVTSYISGGISDITVEMVHEALDQSDEALCLQILLVKRPEMLYYVHIGGLKDDKAGKPMDKPTEEAADDVSSLSGSSLSKEGTTKKRPLEQGKKPRRKQRMPKTSEFKDGSSDLWKRQNEYESYLESVWKARKEEGKLGWYKEMVDLIKEQHKRPDAAANTGGAENADEAPVDKPKHMRGAVRVSAVPVYAV